MTAWILAIASGLFMLAASVVLVLHFMRSAIIRDRTTNAFGRFDVAPSPEAAPVIGQPYRDPSASPAPPSDLEVLRGKRRHALEQAKMWRLRYVRSHSNEPASHVYWDRAREWERKAVEADKRIRALDEDDDMEADG